MRKSKQTGKTSLRLAGMGLALLLTACSPQYENHGYVPPQDQLEQVVVGSDTKESVAQMIVTITLKCANGLWAFWPPKRSSVKW